MALTFPRWLVVCAVGCALIWLGVLSRGLQKEKPRAPQDDPLGEWDRPSTDAPAVLARLSETNDRLRLMQLRDSIVRVAAKDTTGSLAILVDDAYGPSVRRGLDSAIAAQWRALHITPVHRAVVAVLIDTLRNPNGYPRPFRYITGIPIEVFLPSATTNGQCVSIAHLSVRIEEMGQQMRSIVRHNLTSPETIGALLSSCALFTAFGEPGPDISRWLRSRRWSLARYADWNAAPSPWKAVVRPGQAFYGGGRAAWLAMATDPSWLIRGYVAPDGIACLAGEPGACRKVALGGRPIQRDSAWRAAVIGTSGTSVSAFYSPNRATSLGPADGWLVSEMVRTLGQDRFGQFWRSKEPVDVAFKTASGHDLDDWTREWGQRLYGPALVGPAISLAGAGTGVVVLVVGLIVAIAVERKRRVA